MLALSASQSNSHSVSPLLEKQDFPCRLIWEGHTSKNLLLYYKEISEDPHSIEDEMRQFVTLPVKPALDSTFNVPHSGTPITEAAALTRRCATVIEAEVLLFLCLLSFVLWTLLALYYFWAKSPRVFGALKFVSRNANADAHHFWTPLESILVSGAPTSLMGAPELVGAPEMRIDSRGFKQGISHGGVSLSEGRSRTNSSVVTAKRPREALGSSTDTQSKEFASSFVTLSKAFRAPSSLVPAASDPAGHSSSGVKVSCTRDNEPLLDAPSAKEKLLAEQARARLYGKSDAAILANDSAPPVLPSGPEPAAFDLVYHARHELAALEDCDDCHSVTNNALASLKSKQWTEIITGLNLVRQLGIHHSSVLGPRLHEAVPLVVQHVKSLRSSVCKTALLCVSDLIEDFGDTLLPLLDAGGAATSLLSQLLIKAVSKDKKFVIEEAERCLNTVCVTLDPTALYPMLIPYLKHKNQKIRASACECLAAVVVRIPDHSLFSMSAHGKTAMTEVLEAVAPLVSDKMQQAREASRKILLLLRAAFYRCHNVTDDSPSWEGFVAAEIKAPAAASAVLKFTESSPPSFVR